MEEKKRSWILRPVAWACTLISVFLTDVVAYLVFLLGEYLLGLLSGMSVALIVVLVMAFGSVYLGLVTYSVALVPSLMVHFLDWVYPSNHAFRYYFTGIIEIIVSLFVIVCGVIGVLTGGAMIWIYLRYGYLIIAMIVFMITGHTQAEERHRVT